jgi:hypothetical protein
MIRNATEIVGCRIGDLITQTTRQKCIDLGGQIIETSATTRSTNTSARQKSATAAKRKSAKRR